jgi:branched-chain amino acid aminotransferase
VKIWFNSRLVDAQNAHVSVFDHGFLYGDGIYETVHAYNYKVFHWSTHYRRLLNSARMIALRCPWSSQTLEQRIVRVLKANKEPNASIRITVARGPGPLGLDPTVCPEPTLVLLLHPNRDVQKVWREGISIGITNVRRNHPMCLDPQIKSNNSLNTILAKMEAMKMKVFEGILPNLEGYLTEGTTSNIFFVKKGQIYTPSLSCGLLAGVTREAVLKLAKRHGIRIYEGRYTSKDLLHADEVFLSSTTLEIAPVVLVKLAGQSKLHRIGSGKPGPLTQHIHRLFREGIQKELKA